jgi:hypothetical protein
LFEVKNDVALGVAQFVGNLEFQVLQHGPFASQQQLMMPNRRLRAAEAQRHV